jgi:ATP-dependent RNA helicase DeaD
LENKENQLPVDEKYFSDISKRLDSISKEDIVNYFITEKLNHFLDAYKNAPDLNSKSSGVVGRERDDSNHVSVKINIGKQDNLDIKGLFGLINSNRFLKGAEIGKIDLKPQYSVFSVDKSRVDDFIKYLSGSNFRGKNVEVNSQGRVGKSSYSGKRRNVRAGGFKGKRRVSRGRKFK